MNYSNKIFISIAKKTGILFFLIMSILTLCFIYLKYFSLSYKYIDIKSKYLLEKYPDSKIFIAGDSTIEAAIAPSELSPKAINLAYPFGTIFGFSKSLDVNKIKLNDSNIIIANISIASQNDNDLDYKYITCHSDAALDLGFFKLFQRWNINFFKNFFTIIKCRFSDCSYDKTSFAYKNLESSLYSKGQSTRKESVVLSNQVNKSFEDIFEYYRFHNFNQKSLMFSIFKKTLKKIAETNSKIVLLNLPTSSYFNQKYAKLVNIETFLNLISQECQKYSNCFFFNYKSEKYALKKDDIDNNRLYYDLIHLNENGSHYFTSILKRDLKTNGILK